MSSATRSSSHQLLNAQRDALIEHWYLAIAPTNFVPYAPAMIRRQLGTLIDQALLFLIDDTLAAEQAQAIGSHLVALHYRQPEALEATLTVLGQELFEVLPEVAVETPVRMVKLLSGVAFGFTHELRGRVLRDQEAIHRAMLNAQQQTDAAQCANRRKSEFVASMSHEMRTPLHTILGLAESLCDETYSSLTAYQREALEMITKSGTYLLSLTDDVLDLAKIEAGKINLRLVSVDPIAVCQNSLKLVQTAVCERELRVNTAFDFGIAKIVADERRLTQILVNLLDNAIKFTPIGGTIGLELLGDQATHIVRFTVWDAGSGIAAEDQERLFQPFVQLDHSSGGKSNGTGLGLVLVRQLARLHGGDVVVESVPDHGSRFTVTLPLHIAPLAASPEPPEHSANDTTILTQPAPIRQAGSPVKLVLAEDNENNLTLTSTYFSKRGYEVVLARDGSEVVDRVRETLPAVVLMDVQMPKVNGLEAIRRLRSDPTTCDIPIIALTGLTMSGDRERCLAAGANAYLSKPVSLHRMVETIEIVRR